VRLLRFALSVAASLIALAVQAQAPLRVIAFDGGWNLPIWAAQGQGFFEANGVAVTLSYTPNSVYLVTGLLESKFDIALTLMDNVVAYQEGQGEAPITDHPDLFAFLGSDGGFAAFVAAPAVESFADLKGKTVSVDALSTGFAFLVRDLLARNGVAETDVTYVRAGARWPVTAICSPGSTLRPCCARRSSCWRASADSASSPTRSRLAFTRAP
jgi:ABC-type nitrate/sulfonate/bicarbonate transport system substrate-binding protein